MNHCYKRLVYLIFFNVTLLNIYENTFIPLLQDHIGILLCQINYNIYPKYLAKQLFFLFIFDQLSPLTFYTIYIIF